MKDTEYKSPRHHIKLQSNFYSLLAIFTESTAAPFLFYKISNFYISKHIRDTIIMDVEFKWI